MHRLTAGNFAAIAYLDDLLLPDFYRWIGVQKYINYKESD